MAKPKRPKAKKSKSELINNGLEGALFSQGMPGYPGTFGTQNVSQVGNIFSNLRWYFISNMRQQLAQAYCELGLIQTVVNVPVDDAFRGGVEVASKQLSAEQVRQLHDCIDREDDMAKVAQGFKWTRLFGGGGLIIVTDQDPTMPLDVAAIKPETPLDFIPADMWELYYDAQNTQGYSAIEQDEKFEWYSYYGKKLHKSRVQKMMGLAAPSFLRPKLRGWGLSVVEAMVRSINQYLEGTALIYELIGESKVDVYGIKNLTNTLLATGGTELVAKRIQLANQQKDFQHAIVMDGEDKYEQKTLTFSGLAEVMNQVRMQVASDLRMPISKIFGIGSTGFSSGEDDIEVYNAMIESTIRSKAKKDVLQVLELRCQQLFGFVPTDLSIEFQQLRMLSGVDEETVKEKQYNRLLQSVQLGLITQEAFIAACNKNDLLGIQVDPADADLQMDTEGDDGESPTPKDSSDA